jgi:hypothetical protein
MRKTLPARGSALTLVLAATLAVAAPVIAHGATSEPVWITSITGSPDNGFHIVWSDGTQEYTPTRSESIAECSEYDTRVSRVACRASTRTRYRWIGLTKRSLAHAR